MGGAPARSAGLGAPLVAGRPRALSVAGSDSSGGAGIQADQRAFEAVGVAGVYAVTAVTAQGPAGLTAVQVVGAELVRAQIDAAVAGGRPAAVKVGMLASAEVAGAVADALEGHGLWPVVVDPVLRASAGGSLLDAEGQEVVVGRLLARCTLLTPNLPEAAVILGRSVDRRADMPAAAEALAGLGPEAVLLKGGHLEGPASPDLLWAAGRATWLEGGRVAGVARGTGCALSAAIAGHLAQGGDREGACRAAKEYVLRILTIGAGGPVP